MTFFETLHLLQSRKARMLRRLVSGKFLILSSLSILSALAFAGGFAVKSVLAVDPPSMVNACVDEDGALQLLKNNNTCKHNQIPIQIAVGEQTGGGDTYFGLPFINSYNDLSSVASSFAGHDFSHAIFNNSQFRQSNVQGVIFDDAKFNNFISRGSDFSNASFKRVVGDMSVENSQSTPTKFVNADFTDANLSASVFTVNAGPGADMSGANFTNTNLSDIEGMSTATVTGAIWSNTICPDHTNSNSNGNTCVGHM